MGGRPRRFGATQGGKGILVDSEESSFVGVRLDADTRATRTLLRGLREMRDADAAPEPILNNHCPACQFQQRCKSRASATDHLSLLRGMGEEGIAKLARRGIFTITQLSYTFRPRRSENNSSRIRAHSFALQALAIREKKIYILGNPVVPDSPVRIHFDLEGSAERGTAYLIGMIIEDGVSERRFSCWADGDDQQGRILGDFLDIVEGYPDAHLFCYGAFEVAFLKRMRKPGWAEPIDRVLVRTTNLLPIIYSSVYFPVYSNGLKPVGAYLGCRWSEPDASGLQCIVWRKGWEQSRDEALRRTIETYNLEDCAALGQVARFLHGIAAGGIRRRFVRVASPRYRFRCTDRAGEGCRRGLGHRRVPRCKLQCWPRPDDPRAQSKLVGKSLAALDRDPGQ